jgi:hypothetical protein
MNTDEKIRQALQETYPNDLPDIKQYVMWLRIRRAINNFFYPISAHWIQPSRRVHWVGK